MIVQTRQKEGWRIPSLVLKWQQQPWYLETKSKENNEDFYRKHLVVAEEILYSDIEPVVGVIDYVSTDKGIAYFIINKSVTGNFKYNEKEMKPNSGDFMELKLKKTQGTNGSFYKVLSVRNTDKQPSPDTVTEFKGRLKVLTDKKGGQFGFVDKVFIPPNVLKSKNLDNAISISVQGTAIINFNKGKGTWGWKAIKLN